MRTLQYAGRTLNSQLFMRPKIKIVNAEKELRALWNEQGVTEEKQNELIDAIKAKARPGAVVGPFVL